MVEYKQIYPDICSLQQWLDETVPSNDPHFVQLPEANECCERNGCTGRQYLGELALNAFDLAQTLPEGERLVTTVLRVSLTAHEPACATLPIAQVTTDHQTARGIGSGRAQTAITEHSLAICRLPEPGNNGLMLTDKRRHDTITVAPHSYNVDGTMHEWTNSTPQPEDVGHFLQTMRREITRGLSA